MTSLTDKIVAIHAALHEAELPHAFGGALALAWCTQRARGTIDIDVNVFVPPARVDDVLHALPVHITHSPADVQQLNSEGQARLWWDSTPIDLFLNTSEFHDAVATRARFEQFGGAEVPFLSCADLAVFKAMFDRTKDWADLEEMHAAGTLDVERVIGTVAHYLGGDDARIERLRSLVSAVNQTRG
ncbi:hypothetical protein BH10ACT2_BH10ACT2_14680 [soil metagenome]